MNPSPEAEGQGSGGPAARPPQPGGDRPVVTIRCRLDGPLVIDAAAAGGCVVRVIDHLGTEFLQPGYKKSLALCRCGQSGTRPFCDGSHRAAGFQAAEIAPPRPPDRVE